ncbi:peptidase inhibitor family I36 protein [Streptomyces uncialis]|uniref:peptidase inhibitor family I36 protein n=1 Tax=Streptomyces uncialis TaxID=1048205 RepID=UPI0037F143A8
MAMGIRFSRSTVTAAAVATALFALAGSATASTPAEGPAPETGVLTPEEEARLQVVLNQSQPVIATYEGREINLADGWQGAQACIEDPSAKVYCYATAAEANQHVARISLASKAASEPPVPIEAGPTAIADCIYGWVCLFEHSNYSGRMLKWSAGGTKKLGDWNFRDEASSGCVNRRIGGALVYDSRTALPDPYMALGNGYCYKFPSASYPTGGNWNDKADYVQM